MVAIINLIRFTHTVSRKAVGDDDINVNIVSSAYNEINFPLSKVFKSCTEVFFFTYFILIWFLHSFVKKIVLQSNLHQIM